MLKPKSRNPKATLLLLFLNAVREEENHPKNIILEMPVSKRRQQLLKYLDIKPPIIDAALGKGGLSSLQYMSSPDLVVATDALNLLGNFDTYFDRFLESADPYTGTSMYELAHQHGLQIKPNHTIIDRWPYRITEKTTKEKFKTLLLESTGHERYMEFEKA
jgi:hypothetical protein